MPPRTRGGFVSKSKTGPVSNDDMQCPYCKGKNKHAKSQRRACKNGTVKTPNEAKGKSK